MLKEHSDQLEKWFNCRSNRERLVLLLVGCLCIYLVWYVILARPQAIKRAELRQQRTVLQMQARVFRKESQDILQEAADDTLKENILLQKNAKAENKAPTFFLPHDADQVIQAILIAQQNVRLSSLKNVADASGVPTAKYAYRMDFESNYFDTLAYLIRLEKLPWCISWDNLEYKVIKYPDASVTLNMHTVKTS